MKPNFLINTIKIGLFTLLFTPFIKNTNYYFPFVGLKGLYFMAIVEVVFFVWLILAWHWKQYRPDLKNPVIAAILIFLAVIFTSAVFGTSFSASFWSKFERMSGVLMSCHLVAFAVVISSIFKNRDWIQIFVASNVAALVIGIEALFDTSEAARGGGFIGNDSFWGIYILFNIFIAFYLFLSQKWREHKILKIFGGSAFLALTICLLFEGTQFWASVVNHANYSLSAKELLWDIINNGARAAKISFAAGMILLGILWLATRRILAVKIIGLALIISSILCGGAVVILSTQPGSVVYQIMERQFNEGTIRGRIVVWEIAWKGFLERPLLGWGPENFDLAFARYYNPCLGTEECASAIWYDRAHNIVFDILVTTGILGLVSYLTIFGTALFVLWKKYFANKIGFTEAGIFTSILVAYFLQNLTVFDMIVSYLMWFICLGFIASFYKSKTAEEKVWPRPIKLKGTFVVIALAAFCFFNFIIGPYSADRDVALAAKKPFGSYARFDFYKKTFNDSPLGQYQIRIFFAQKWLEFTESDFIKQLNTEGIKGEFSILTEELEKSRQEISLDYKSRLILGQLYNRWSLFDKTKLALAQQVLKEAMALSPKNQQSYWYLAQTELYQKKLDDALALAQQAYDLYPQHPQAEKVLGEIKEIKTKLENNK